MKKFLTFVFFISISYQIKAWTYFTIKNNSNNAVEFKTATKTKTLLKNENYSIINYTYSKNPIITTTKHKKIIMGKNEDWFKIGEKKIPPERTYTIAPRIDIKPGRTTTIKVNNVFQNKPLPQGFKYHKYALGLKEVNKGTKPYITHNNIKNPLFYIENDTFYEVNLLTCNSNNKIKIKPMKKSSRNILLPGERFTINPPLYENYKPSKEIMFATRYKIIDAENIFRLEIKIDKSITLYTIQIKPNLVPKTILKISNLTGFKIQTSNK